MPKIIIMNQGTEHTRGYDPTRSEPLRKSVGRCSWFADRGDVIISPVPIEREFIRSIGDTLGFDANSVSVLVQDHLRAEGLLVSEDDVRSLRSMIAGPDAWSIMPCFWTPDVAAFASQLGLGDPVTLAFASQRGPELFNRKRHFRQLAAGASVPIPEGSIVTSVSSLERAIEKHLSCTGTVIVKKDDAAGGLGNLTLTTGPVRALPGSRDTREVGDVRARPASVWEELTDSHSQALVVEVYHAISYSFYFEYFIGDDAIPRFLHSGDVRFREPDDAKATELVWVGLDTPTELPHASLAHALMHAGRFAALMARVGCRGHMNIDAIVTTQGELLFNESNVRWGGGSSLHAIGERLLSPRFADEYALSLVRDVKCPPRPEVVRMLSESSLRFSPSAREGVIVLACEEHEAGAMECLVIGRSRPRVRELERSLRGMLGVRDIHE
jgi:hypothetical protein